MEDDKDLEALKHVCKLCNKRYSNGKSLGGHMRSHVIANSKKNKLKVSTFDDDSGYGLRENPKKSWRFDLDFKKVDQIKQICKQCGKGFQSVKALCGHMSCHSDKNRNFRVLTISDDDDDDDDESWSTVNHSDDDHDRNSEIDHLEQEDVAICLMMLSRDSSSSYKTDSSDNNSVIFEGNLNLGSKIKNVDQEMDNSDSGYFENGAKELESVDSNAGFLGSCYNSVTKVDPKKRIRVRGFGFDSPEIEKSSSKKKLSSSANYKPPQSCKATSYAKKGIKIKGHICPYCPKVFKSGQALGGHKRSHMMGGGGGFSMSRRPRSPDPPPEKSHMLDLNLPAPLEEEATSGGSSQFVGSW